MWLVVYMYAHLFSQFAIRVLALLFALQLITICMHMDHHTLDVTSVASSAESLNESLF
jgi:hypothetical protein